MATQAPTEHVVNLDAARRFLAHLAPDDSITFQTFDDSSNRRSGPIRIIHGNLDSHATTLSLLNERGAGIFWMVNRGDCAGRKAENVLAVRVACLDLDGAPLDPVFAAGVPPHAVIESSPDKWHVYWKVSNCGLAQFKPLQQALARKFDGDPKIVDLCRVLRVPGFLHRKGIPFEVRIHQLRSLPPYDAAELTTRLGLRVAADGHAAPSASTPTRPQETTPTEEDRSTQTMTSVGFGPSSVGRLEIPANCIPQVSGQRNVCLFRLARYVRGCAPNMSRPERRALLQDWYARALHVIRTEDFSVSWVDFERAWGKVKTPHGEIMNPILVDAQHAPMPRGIGPLGYGDAGNLLVRVCAALHAHQQSHFAGEPFFLSSRQAGEAVGVHFTDAAKMLRALVSDGVLELVKQGSGKLASRYHFVWKEP